MRKILLISLLIPLCVFADRVTKKTQTSITFAADLSPGLALAANKERKGLIISNQGADAIQIQFGATTATGNADHMHLAATSSYEFKNVPMDAIYVKGAASTGTKKVGIIEFE